MNSAGVFTIEAGHPALPGHFPGQPIVPGVVLLDHAVLRIAAALGRAPQPSRLASVKFLATVTPNEPVTVRYASVGDDPAGDQADHHASHQAEHTVRFELEGPGRTVASGMLTLPGAAGPTDAVV
ncbi:MULTISPECIES: hypothetical protein [Cupriavidus]|uniref:hypothetical protein n=1 Tax=Cupriavidus sp. HPC(L) TaxID=1217418 RepID=UPI000291665F|nr:hypothetical protein [Cupriavidus sp. HPC(L)]